MRRPLRIAASRLRGWSRLPGAQKLELAYLVVLALAAEIAVRVVPLPVLARKLGIALGDGDSSPRAGDVPHQVVERAQAVDRLYRVWPRRGSCLRRALVLGFRVRHAQPVLRVGVAPDGDGVRAHAWVEIGGVVIGEDAAEFAPLRRADEHLPE